MISGTMLGWISLAMLVLVLGALVPVWPYSRRWGYVPGGLVGLALLALVVLFLVGSFG